MSDATDLDILHQMQQSGKFFRGICSFRARSNQTDKHVSLNLELTYRNPLSIPLWLETFEMEKIKLLRDPERWFLSYFQVLERASEDGTEPAFPLKQH